MRESDSTEIENAMAAAISPDATDKEIRNLAIENSDKASRIYALTGDKSIYDYAVGSIKYSGYVDGLKYVISSAGYWSGNYSSIVINGTEYSKNCRGLNIVVVENGVVSEAIAFDTWAQEMTVTR